MAKVRKRKGKKPIPQQQNSSLPFIVAGVVVVILLIGLIVYNQSASQVVVANVEVDYPTGITEDGEPFKGGAEASVVIEEFGDFACSHCGSFHKSVQEISDEYIKTGKIQLVFRNYAFLGQGSKNAAQGSECALEQGSDAFWAYHDVLFENQTLGSAAFQRSSLKDIAAQIGLDTSAFNSCLNGNKTATEVEKDRSEGATRGVDSTPTLFINGQEYGGMDASGLRSVIDRLLN